MKLENLTQIKSTTKWRDALRHLATIVALPLLVLLLIDHPREPVFGGDANRHVMTSVFFRDLIVDGGFTHPKQYAEQYFDQYPALSLLHFPPLFHGIVGGLMTVFGTSVMVARAFNFACFLMACFLLHRLLRRRMSVEQTQVAVVLFALMPMVLDYSRYVMLEMPTLALSLLCIDQFDVWLNGNRRRPLYIAAVSAALAALTRFDAIMLLPTLLLMVTFTKQWRRIASVHVVFAVLVALILVTPTYGLIWHEKGDMHLRQAVESVGGEQSQFLASGCLWFYPVATVEQAGWIVPLLAAVGLLICLIGDRKKSAPFLALTLATYLTFTPLAELRARHAIYWLPALAYFAVVGGTRIANWIVRESRHTASRQLSLRAGAAVCAFYVCAMIGTSWATLTHPSFVVSGYRNAAQLVLDKTLADDTVLLDAWWDGNFTYHLRHLDPSRSRRVIRGDQLFYDFLSVPNIDFKAFVETDVDILRAIQTSDARMIVFENPQPFDHIPLSEKFQTLVKTRPQEFPLAAVVPVQLQFCQARPFDLRIFQIDADRLSRLIQSMEESNRTELPHKETIK